MSIATKEPIHMETNYKQIAKEARIKVLGLIYLAQTSHVGSNFSCIDIMTVLFEKIDLKKDNFVLSKGWAAASLYYFLWRKGKITEEQLNSYCQPGSKFIGLAEPVVPEIMIAGGSMGMGLPGAVGLALAKKLKGEDGKVYVLMSDGELAIGTTWESALIAAHHKLDNLVVIVDRNGFQAMGKTEDVLTLEPQLFPVDKQPMIPLTRKFDSFGWASRYVMGHDHGDLEKYLGGEIRDPVYRAAPELVTGKPLVLFAITTKGKGVSFMENNNIFHYKSPSEDEYKRALAELNV